MSYLRHTLASGRLRGGFAMGDAATAATPTQALITQINRFVAAPAGYQFVTTPFPVDSPLDAALATIALTIYQRRATDAYSQFKDAGSLQAIQQANAGFADPVAFVSTHMAEVTQTIGGFADYLQLADPSAAVIGGPGGPSRDTLLLAAGMAAGILALWWVMR